MAQAAGLPFDGRAAWTWTCSVASPALRPGTPGRVAYFRRTFAVPAAGADLVAHVSADSRYVLYCNGVRVARGPAKGDVEHQFYDTVDLSPRLRRGANVLAAVVVSWVDSWPSAHAMGAPASLMTATSAFILDAWLLPRDGAPAVSLCTGDGWKALADRSIRHVSCPGVVTHTGMGEEVDGRLYPWGWQEASYDDSDWPAPFVIEPGARPDTLRDSNLPYRLVARTIPFLEESERRFVDAWNVPGPEGSLAGKETARSTGASPLRIAAGGTASFVLDAGELTTGFPVLRARGGPGTVVRLTYAEALTVEGRKSPFHDPARGTVEGHWDTWTLAEGTREYEPLHWRTFRYVRVDVEAAGTAAAIEDIGYRFCAYPGEAKASFSSSDPGLSRVWDMAWRTMRLCTHETFEDCPYYEQLQYAGDVHVEQLAHGLVTGDWRLARQALAHFDWSRGPEGLTRSRYPSRVPQFIPSWSLLWVMAVRDYWMHSGDLATAAACADGIAACLGWFDRHANADGLLEALPYWKVVDWVREWQDPGGYPPGAEGGISSILTFQWAAALRAAAEVEDALGHADDAAAYRARADRACAATDAACWNEAEGLWTDRPGGPERSELAQAWAVLGGAASEARAARACAALGTDPRLAKATFYGRSYVFRALSAAGRYDLAAPLFDWWLALLDTDLTTIPEEPLLGRSYCHAWSCAPLYEMLSEVLGVRPGAPGFASVIVAPKPLWLSRAEGAVQTPRGPVAVRWERDGPRMCVSVRLPEGVPGSLRLPGGRTVGIPAGGAVEECEPS